MSRFLDTFDIKVIWHYRADQITTEPRTIKRGDTRWLPKRMFAGDDVTRLLAHAKALETLLAKFHAGVIYCPACHRHMNPASHTADCECTALLHAE